MATNPIRKVVAMLQAMQSKVMEEAEKETVLYDKFMCYCSTNGRQIAESITDAESKAPSLGAEIKKAEEQKAQTQEELAQAQTDLAGCKSTMSEAAALREKDAKAYAAQKDEYTSNGEAIQKALDALEKGMSSGFLQTSAGQVLQRFAQDKVDMLMEGDRQELLSFLASADGSEYAPQSSEVSGIMKQIRDQIAKQLAESIANEETSIKQHEMLMAAKKREVAALAASIEAKMKKVGELSVQIMQSKTDLTDTQQALLADKQFLTELKEGCKTKAAEWEERGGTRSQELAAIADTIKVLNDDDAIGVFKKTLHSSASSFVQVMASDKMLRAEALVVLRVARGPKSLHRAQFDLIALALRGKKVGYEKVIEVIDDMVATLQKEQADDETEKEYCTTQLDAFDEKKNVLERTVSDEATAIANVEEAISRLEEDIAKLKTGIMSLDKAVAEATTQRKQENEEYKEAMASDTAAKELLTVAKDRLNKFYNPAVAEPSAAAAVFVQVSRHTRHRGVPPPPPETFGAYTTKSGESAGVTHMIDLLVRNLEKDMKEAEKEEKDSQADYEALMKDSAAKRTQDATSLTQKEDAKADLEEDLESSKAAKASWTAELMSAVKHIQQLHTECDFLLKYFDVRKEARTSEVEALGQAKSVLSGLEVSLLQAEQHGSVHQRH